MQEDSWDASWLLTSRLGEGDDWFFIDGEKIPSLKGTGTEDYFCDAWGFRKFSTPFHGVSLWEGYFAGDRVTAYRWHLADPITFEKSLKFSIEHRGSIFQDKTGLQTGTFVERADWISSVAFWYQSPPVTFDKRLAPAQERIAPYRVIQAEKMVIRTNPKNILRKQTGGVTYIPRKPDASIEFDFEVSEAGRYQINAFIMHSVFGSRYQAFIDDKPMGAPRDFCISGADALWTRFDVHELKKGKPTLKFSGRGKSPRKRSLAVDWYAFSMNYLILLRLEDLVVKEKK